MTAALAGEGIRGAAAAALGGPLGGGVGSSSSSTSSELQALAVKEWILIKWKVVEEQRLELTDEWEAACRRHNRLRGLPDSSERGRSESQKMGRGVAVLVIFPSTRHLSFDLRCKFYLSHFVLSRSHPTPSRFLSRSHPAPSRL